MYLGNNFNLMIEEASYVAYVMNYCLCTHYRIHVRCEIDCIGLPLAAALETGAAIALRKSPAEPKLNQARSCPSIRAKP